MFDVPFKGIVDIVLKVDVGGYSFEAANPRHEHEWQVWKSAKPPPGRSLLPGVLWTIMWAKLKSLAEGAAIASAKLWG